MKRVRSPSVESSATFHTPCDNCKIEDTILAEDPTVFNGSLNGRRVKVLKDNECNTNFVSREYFEKNKKYPKWKEYDVEARHSKLDLVERSS